MIAAGVDIHKRLGINPSRRLFLGVIAWPMLVSALIFAAYSNTWNAPLTFDDGPSIVDNPSFRDIRAALWPASGTGYTVEGRPALNFSLYITHRLGGSSPTPYHLTNVFIHISAAVLAGLILASTFRGFARGPQPGRGAAAGWGAAALWALHPLQTEAVTYSVQRAESQMGLLCLLAVFATLQGARSRRPRRWYTLAVAAAALAVATKETAIVLPVFLLLYDRQFLSGSFSAAFRDRRGLYIALSFTWLESIGLICASHGRGGTVELRGSGYYFTYLSSQCSAIIHYIRLAIWPRGLVFDYGRSLIFNAHPILSCLVIALALGWSVKALVAKNWAGFLGLSFFLWLAPSTGAVPITSQVWAEHRMYLPLLALVAAVWIVVRRLESNYAVVALWILALTAGFGSWERNQIYRSEISLWSDTVRKLPLNPRAQNNLGRAFLLSGDVIRSIPYFERALSLGGESALVESNLGAAYSQMVAWSQAVIHLRNALVANPMNGEAHENLGEAYLRLGKYNEAEAEFIQARRIRPAFIDLQENALGLAEMDRSAPRAAIPHFQAALKARSGFAEAHVNLANAARQIGDLETAVHHYRNAIALRPNDAIAHYNLGNVYYAENSLPAAISEYRLAVRIDTSFAEAECNLGIALKLAGQSAEAREHILSALKIRPDFPLAKAQLQ